MKENTKTILVILLTMSLICNAWLYWREPLVKETKVEVVKHDTIVKFQLKTDTIHWYKIKYKNKVYYDTVHVNDYVYIRDTAVVHRDSTENYSIDISAVKLDWYKLDIHARDTITTEKIINNTIYKPKKNNFTVGLSVGYGYGLIHQKPDAFVGVTATYNIIK